MKRQTGKNRTDRLLGLILSIVLTITLTSCGRAQNPETAAQSEGATAATTQGAEAVAGKNEENGSTSESTTVRSTSSDTVLEITALKAGAADAFVLIFGDHVTIIDTGLDKKADKLVAFLQERGITRVDEMIITHFDKDHVGGADHILENFDVGVVYTTYHSKQSDDIDSYLLALSDKGMKETTVTENTTFEVGDISFTIYPPETKVYADKMSNNSSLVIKVSLGENSMLFAGDAEAFRIQELLKTENLESTILKVPHHGRYDVYSEALIEYVKPEYAIITSSKSEPEDQEVLDILEKNNVTTYLTREGEVMIIMTEDDIKVAQ